MFTVNSPLRADEFLGPVQRVDQPEAPAHLRDAASRHRFFGHHGDVRGEAGQAGQDHGLGALVGLGDGRGVGLAAHREIGGIHGQYRVAGGARQRQQGVAQGDQCGCFHSGFSGAARQLK
jgi:hypothetical protein